MLVLLPLFDRLLFEANWTATNEKPVSFNPSNVESFVIFLAGRDGFSDYASDLISVTYRSPVVVNEAILNETLGNLKGKVIAS